MEADQRPQQQRQHLLAAMHLLARFHMAVPRRLPQQGEELGGKQRLQAGDGGSEIGAGQAGRLLRCLHGSQQRQRFGKAVLECRQTGGGAEIVAVGRMAQVKAQAVTQDLQILADHPLADLELVGQLLAGVTLGGGGDQHDHLQNTGCALDILDLGRAGQLCTHDRLHTYDDKQPAGTMLFPGIWKMYEQVRSNSSGAVAMK